MPTLKPSKPTWQRGERRTVLPVHFSIPLPCSVADVIEKIAENLKLRIEGLPDQLRAEKVPSWLARDWDRTKDEHGTWFLIVDGAAGDKLHDLTSIFENVYYLSPIVGRKLRFRVAELRSVLTAFDELAGRLTHEVKRVRKRIPDDEYRRIMAALDKAGFSPIDYLEGKWRDDLGDWNNRHSRKGKVVKTFLGAYLNPELKRGVLLRLNHAQRKYRKENPEA